MIRTIERTRSLFISYVLSFVFVGMYWNNHHHLLQVYKQVSVRALVALLWFVPDRRIESRLPWRLAALPDAQRCRTIKSS